MKTQLAYVDCKGNKDAGKKPHVFLDTKGDRICPDCNQPGQVAWLVRRKKQ